MTNKIAIRVVRVLFTLLCVGLGVMYRLGMTTQVDVVEDSRTAGLIGGLIGLGFAALLVLVDIALRAFTIRSFSSATVGLMIGVLCAWLITRLPDLNPNGPQEYWVRVTVTMVYCALGYLGMVIALRSNQQEFSLIIPYVRFRNEGVLRQSHLVDQDTIIDGQLPQLFATGFLNGTVIVPREAIDHLTQLADSEENVLRLRGRRDLDCLDALRKIPKLEVTVQETANWADSPPEARLIGLAKSLDARLLTKDANLVRVAQLQGVETLNLTALAEGLRPSYAVGEGLELALLKEGKEDHQAVGYTKDGTMIVVNHGRSRIGNTVFVVVSSSVQTSAGRLIFAELQHSPRQPVSPRKTAN